MNILKKALGWVLRTINRNLGDLKGLSAFLASTADELRSYGTAKATKRADMCDAWREVVDRIISIASVVP